eukprot:5290760-Pleurochrysis_carterae.AAC.3
MYFTIINTDVCTSLVSSAEHYNPYKAFAPMRRIVHSWDKTSQLWFMRTIDTMCCYSFVCEIGCSLIWDEFWTSAKWLAYVLCCQLVTGIFLHPGAFEMPFDGIIKLLWLLR